MALAIPESRVIGLPETVAGGIAPAAADALRAIAPRINAVVIGPGMQDEPSVCEFVAVLLPSFRDAKVVLDAYAMGVLCKSAHRPQPSSHPPIPAASTPRYC